MNLEKKEYAAVDLYKLLMAIFIVVSHTNPFVDFNKWIEVGIRDCIVIVAVPFFFSVTGFFSLKDTESAKKTCIRLLKLYVIWSIIYFPFSIIKNIGEGKNLFYYLQSFFLWGSFDTIWYLLAAGVAIAIAWLFLKKDALKWSCALGFVLYILALLGTSYAGLIQGSSLWKVYEKYYEIFHTFKNGAFFGLIFVSLGGLMRKHVESHPQKEADKRKLIVATVISLALVILESIMLVLTDLSTKGVDLKFFLIPFTVSVFGLLLNLDLRIKPKTAIHARKLSTLIFLTQRIFLSAYTMLGIHDKVNSFVWFAIILVSTVAFSELLIYISSKCRFVKALY